MTEIAIRAEQTSLTLASEQTYWNDNQLAALKHMGVENASPGDLAVFFHVVKRTGLDPFARQIHMIGRNTKNQRSQQWETKYTIQTGIDGYRLIGRRAADHARVKVSLSAPEWAREDGQWLPLWSPKWGLPLAARVTVFRDGEPFPAVALFDEYKQTRKDGGLTSMWAQRPAGQLAKCAEALAWRMAFPQDMQGVYVEDEMHQADNARPERPEQTQAVSVTAFTATPETPVEDVSDSVQMVTKPQQQKMHALFNEQGITDRTDRLNYTSGVIGRDVSSSNDLTAAEASQLIEHLVANATPADSHEALWEGDQS